MYMCTEESNAFARARYSIRQIKNMQSELAPLAWLLMTIKIQDQFAEARWFNQKHKVTCHLLAYREAQRLESVRDHLLPFNPYLGE